jgi:transcriptional regulator with XRE-family HTH domain
MTNFSERLEKAIQRAGISKGALALKLNVPQSSVSRWLSGSEPRLDKLTEIAKFLSVDVKWLMYGPPPETKAQPEPNIKSIADFFPAKPPPPIPADPALLAVLTRIATALEALGPDPR